MIKLQLYICLYNITCFVGRLLPELKSHRNNKSLINDQTPFHTFLFDRDDR
jgi:hypothetical protein